MYIHIHIDAHTVCTCIHMYVCIYVWRFFAPIQLKNLELCLNCLGLPLLALQTLVPGGGISFLGFPEPSAMDPFTDSQEGGTTGAREPREVE